MKKPMNALRPLDWLVYLLALIAVGAGIFVAAERAFGQARRGGTSAAELTNKAQVLLVPAPTRTLTYCVIQGGAAAEQVIFRGVGGSPTYATVNIAAGAVVGRSLQAAIPAGGLEVLTSDPAGDVTVECTYRLGS
jgi:hypothetical protein